MFIPWPVSQSSLMRFIWGGSQVSVFLEISTDDFYANQDLESEVSARMKKSGSNPGLP